MFFVKFGTLVLGAFAWKFDNSKDWRVYFVLHIWVIIVRARIVTISYNSRRAFGLTVPEIYKIPGFFGHYLKVVPYTKIWAKRSKVIAFLIF